MKIDQITTVDLVALHRLIELESEAFGIGGLNEWTLIPLIRHGRVYAAYENNNVIGLIQYMLDWDKPERAYMVGVSMAKEVRERGLGTTFIAKTMQILANDHINEVELTVDPKNLVAFHIYEKKLGFMAKEIRKDEYGIGEDRIIMLLSLKNLRK